MLPAVTAILLVVIHVVGVIYAIHAILRARSSTAAIAWAITLIEFPYITLPLYWVFGRDRFRGYVAARRRGTLQIHEVSHFAMQMLAPYTVQAQRSPYAEYHLHRRLVGLPVTRGNEVELLKNGDAAFPAVFDAIDHAKHYIIVQFFIVHDDETGRELQQRLIRQAQRGRQVYFLYDEIGSYHLSRRYIRELRQAGVHTEAFGAANWGHRFQINFRNHRKLVIVDGHQAFLGGMNVGDEYLGKRPKFSPWRDTNIRVSGGAVQCLQISFLEDWYWATRTVPELNWAPAVPNCRHPSHIQVIPSSPADPLPTCNLSLLRLFNAAKNRLWICSPYFVPDQPLASALKLAALRGIDVRIMLPERADHLLVYLCSFSYLQEMIEAGVKFYRYTTGFMHQKVMLVDDEIACVGTVNLDNRSVYLAFEHTTMVINTVFARQIADMLEEDFRNCIRVSTRDYTGKTVWFKIGVAASRLLEPIL